MHAALLIRPIPSAALPGAGNRGLKHRRWLVVLLSNLEAKHKAQFRDWRPWYLNTWAWAEPKRNRVRRLREQARAQRVTATVQGLLGGAIAKPAGRADPTLKEVKRGTLTIQTKPKTSNVHRDVLLWASKQIGKRLHDRCQVLFKQATVAFSRDRVPPDERGSEERVYTRQVGCPLQLKTTGFILCKAHFFSTVHTIAGECAPHSLSDAHRAAADHCTVAVDANVDMQRKTRA
ncbi:hypothetical protein SVAN01_01717 [Stagonosporopsis vannaccii]|nr:hypothetical protein SVAN01_01717 [Stagonosporopsis vannaccii]